jgi:hypothetical protein
MAWWEIALWILFVIIVLGNCMLSGVILTFLFSFIFSSVGYVMWGVDGAFWGFVIWNLILCMNQAKGDGISGSYSVTRKDWFYHNGMGQSDIDIWKR